MGLLGLVLGKDARRYIKRKDSDAGETGRALEELRGALYSELRTSEGAKRQQQRMCGPIVAMTFNFMVAVGIILGNKLPKWGAKLVWYVDMLSRFYHVSEQPKSPLSKEAANKGYGLLATWPSLCLLVMGRVGFNFPISLTLIHYASAWILLAILKAFSLLPVAPPTKTTPFSSLFSLGVVMAFASGLANTSLKHNSVGFYQMAKISVTPTIVLAEFILFRKTISLKKILALAVVSVGVAVATVTDLEFNLFGACIAVAWIIPSAINKILWSNLQQEANWTALALMWKTTPVTIFFLLALLPWLDPPGVSSFSWNLHNSSAVLTSAALGFLLQWSGALALGATSATSHVVLGQFKTCVILVGGYVLFDSDPGFVSICGAVTALVGMSVYTYLNLRKESQESIPSHLPSQASFSSKPKATEDKPQQPEANAAAANAV